MKPCRQTFAPTMRQILRRAMAFASPYLLALYFSLRSMLRRLTFEAKIAAVLISVSILSVFAGIYLLSRNDFYDSKDNVNGIWVEMHGVIIEFILVGILFAWYQRTQETSRKKSLLDVLHDNLSDTTASVLSALLPDYMMGEKLYVYFGRKMCIQRAHDNDVILASRLVPANEDLSRLGVVDPSTMIHDHKAVVGDMIRIIDSISSAAIGVLEDVISSLMVEVRGDAAGYIKTLEKWREIVKGPEWDIRKFLEEKQVLVYHLIEMQEALRSAADRVLSREEHRLEQEMEVDRLKRMMKRL